MKRLFLLTWIVLNSTPIFCQEIKMEKDGGVYKVPCKVNGLSLKVDEPTKVWKALHSNDAYG